MKQASSESETGGAFWRILETLMSDDERADANATRRPAGRSMPFWDAGESRNRRRSRGAARPSDFLDFFKDGRAREPEAEMPAMEEVRPEDISAELAIEDRHDLSDLGRIRKSFAAANHPDRISPAKRQWAEERMKLANSIIDEEIARRRARIRT